MKKVIGYRLWVMGFFVFLFLIYHSSLVTYNYCFAQPVSSKELISNTKGYDGKTVIYAGEVIGDIMRRGDYAWVNVNDGEGAIGIWMKAALAQEIIYAGSYKSKGDKIEVSGVFHRACPEHGGDLDIHAETLRKIQPGIILNKKLGPHKKNLSLGLLGILCLILILRRFGNR